MRSIKYVNNRIVYELSNNKTYIFDKIDKINYDKEQYNVYGDEKILLINLVEYYFYKDIDDLLLKVSNHTFFSKIKGFIFISDNVMLDISI